ncbi:hypothetical protein HanXRQr2_Chr14g0662241 [Helianthus annuus]|uniref:Uncharacterized protein n=1 Tax=Helianthus annuus TaxID=4232 RepID=A0A9K3EC00_HELAN|nr:hypothetical protein HanXRQr2_Chr14g0662241 [Helianthus annuus]KAJ0841887.1 hypothetical protein HanPSC8_Chr14g0635501 [Helianthus annuus]
MVGSGVGKIGAAACRGLFGRGGIGRSKVITELSFDQFTGFILVLPNGGPGLVGPCNGTSFHFALQTGQILLPCFTFEAIHWKWNECEHSAVKIA